MEVRNQQFLTIAYMNIRGQTGLSLSKQLQIQDFISQHQIDILHLQEINICDDTFSECNKICSAYNIFSNNSQSKYGTDSLVKSDLPVDSILCDTGGRALVFNINNLTFANVYLQSGSDGLSRSSRENYCSEVIPQLLLNRKEHGCMGGDFNCIINKADATHNPDSKISPSLKRLVKPFDMKDSFRELHPASANFSRYYENDRTGEGASRIDRNYHWGQLSIDNTRYVSVAFSDHMSHVVTICLPDPLNVILSPKTRPLFSIKANVAKDPIFQERLQDSMTGWLEVKALGLEVIPWWEVMVKPGIKQLAIQRSKEINQDRRSEINLYLLRQAYLTKKLQGPGRSSSVLTELRIIQRQIERWYCQESEKIKAQSRIDEYQQDEKTRIYHHDLHKKKVKRSSILKLQTPEGILEGHDACA